MNNNRFNLTIEDLEWISKSPKYALTLNRIKVNEGLCNYSEFLNQLYSDLSRTFNFLCESAHKRLKDDEDRITTDILGQMKILGWAAYHEANSNGKVDITIDSGYYKWIGEAKIDHSTSNMLKGFQQLFTRYTTGVNYESAQDRNENATECGIFFYIKNSPNYSDLKPKWQKSITKFCEQEGYTISFVEENEIYTHSIHEHPKSGLTFKIKYMPLLLHFSPKDK